jgi:hypothetical protein
MAFPLSGSTVDTGYVFAPDAQPMVPGSPYAPPHPWGRRIAYGSVAVLLGVCATLGNALVTANVVTLAGSLGGDVAQVTWLPAIYVAFNAVANLLLIRARMQFGIPAISYVLLGSYAAAALLQCAVPGLATAAIARAVSGLAAAGVIALCIFNLLQTVPARHRPRVIVIAVVLPQLGVPLARLFPVEMLAAHSWQGLHLIELALALCALAAVTALPLPPSPRQKAFEPLDALTIGLLLPAFLGLCAVLGLGRVLWWTDTPWLGWALAGSIVLFACAAIVELRRATPLLHLRWFASGDMLRFLAVALLVRIALAEQTYGAVGLLSSGGLTNDQLHVLFAIVLVAMLTGALLTAVTITPGKWPSYHILSATLLIAWGAALDSQANALTRPVQLYFSQALIAFGTTLFIGPVLIAGFGRMLARGTDHFTSFITLFNVSQNVGGLAGAALLGSYQVIQTRAHAGALSEHLLASDAQVLARLQDGAHVFAGTTSDPTLAGLQGAGLLGQALTRQATVLAYNDVFSAVVALALLTTGLMVVLIIRRKRLESLEAHA